MLGSWSLHIDSMDCVIKGIYNIKPLFSPVHWDVTTAELIQDHFYCCDEPKQGDASKRFLSVHLFSRLMVQATFCLLMAQSQTLSLKTHRSVTSRTGHSIRPYEAAKQEHILPLCWLLLMHFQAWSTRISLMLLYLRTFFLHWILYTSQD